MATIERKYSKFSRWILKKFGIQDPDKLDHVESMYSSNELDDTYVFDFKNWTSQYSGGGFLDVGTPIAFGSTGSVSEQENKVEHKIKLKPIEALDQLERVPTPWDLVGLDDKIFVMKDKEKLIVQSYAKREVKAIIERFQNRKHYNEHKTFFDNFQNTTDEKIADLLKNHDHLVMKTSDIFVPEFPNEAIKIMKDYTEKVNLVCGKKPVFYVIAMQGQFQKAYEKRDPILLVQSPFGFYWQILGAWDEEMLLLSEL